MQNCKEAINNQGIQPGKRVSFCISPKPFQNLGNIAPGEVELTAMSEIKGKMAVVQDIPITLDVEWEIEDAQGNTATEGIDYLAPNGKKGLEISLIFIPRKFVELTSDSSVIKYQLPTQYTLKANISSKAGENNVVSGIKKIALAVFPLAVPIIFSSYNNPDFTLFSEGVSERGGCSEYEGKLLIITPENSLIRSKEDLINILEELRNTISTLILLPDFFLFNLGLCLLYNSILSHKNIQFRNRTKVNLHCIKSHDVWDWDCQISSIILIGPPNCSVTCTNEISNPKAGQFTISTEPLKSTCYALVRKLDSESPVSEPSSNCIKVDEKPRNNTFNNSISLLKINPLPIKPVII